MDVKDIPTLFPGTSFRGHRRNDCRPVRQNRKEWSLSLDGTALLTRRKGQITWSRIHPQDFTEMHHSIFNSLALMRDSVRKEAKLDNEQL